LSAQDNKAVVARLLTAWNDSDFHVIEEELVASHFVNHNPPPVPGIGRDRDGMLAAMRYMRQAFPDGRAESVNLVAEDDKVVVQDVVRGTHQGEFMGVSATGRQVSFEFIHIFRLADGRIVERWGLVDAMGLMMQLGAIPTPQAAEAGG
jgi:predicted ester cyclase